MADKDSKDVSLSDKWNEQMKLIQDKTGIQGNYVIIGLIASIVFVSIGFLDRFITNLVGTVYPAYWTMKSIESKGHDDKHWLTYWVVFACFTIVDVFSGFLLKFIPFYFFIKIIFLIWLFMPNSKGCNVVYHLLVVRVFKSFEQDIDNASGKLGEITKEFIHKGTVLIEENKNKLIQKSTETIIENTFSSAPSLNQTPSASNINNPTSARKTTEKNDKPEKKN